jgi:photosystem II stability/assembly factor-like uncharacterized protein
VGLAGPGKNLRVAARLVSLLFAAALAGIAGAAPGVGGWRSGGPFGGTVSAFEIHPARPAILYAGTYGAGVFKSTDRGATWQRSSRGLPPDTLVLILELAPSQPSTLYLQAYSPGRIFVSTDAGASWAPLPGPPGGVNDLDVHPTHAQTVYIATHEGVYRWDGAAWSRLSGETDPRQPRQLAIAPSSPNVLYAESGGAVFRSADGGSRWTKVWQGLENFDVFEVDSRDASTLYVSTHDELRRSSDGGAHWTPLGRGWEWGRHVGTLAVNGRFLAAGTRWTGVWVSGDGGATWRRTAGLPREPVLDVERAPDGALFAGLDHRGVVRIAGSRAVERSRGLVGTEVRALAVDPVSRRVVYAGTTGGGVWRSPDAGRTWSRRGLLGRRVASLAIGAVAPATLLAATDGGVFRTTDAGRTWRRARGVPAATSVAIAPSSRRLVYAGTFEHGFYRSSDGGRSFRRTRTKVWQATLSIAVAARNPRTLWAGTRYNGVTISHDGGDTWTDGRGVPTHSDPFAIAFDPRRPRTMYAALDAGGVYRSGDAGASWTRASAGLPLTTALALAVDRNGAVYTGGYDPNGRGGVFRSADGGRTWANLTGGMTTTWVSALALSPAGVLYAGTTAYGRESGGGVFVRRIR